MKRRYQIFVSSTYTDLIEERKEVTQAILECNCFPAGMELFPASNKSQWNIIKQVIDDSDFYLLIIAGRYGSLGTDDNGKKISYTEMEFDYALSKNKPIIVLIHESPESLPSKYVEKSKSTIQKLEKFKAKAMDGRMVKFWNNKDQLHSAVLYSLQNTIRENADATGWIRAMPSDLEKQKNENIPTVHLQFSNENNISNSSLNHINKTNLNQNNLNTMDENFRDSFLKTNVFYHALKIPRDYEKLNLYLHHYATNIHRSLSEEKISYCMNLFENVRKSYILEISGNIWSIINTAVHMFSAKNCLHLICIAEVPHSCDLLDLRNVILDIYEYACKDSLLMFALNYDDNIPRNNFLLRFIFSENICEENKNRERILKSRKVASIDSNNYNFKLLPRFFTDYPEERYYMMPLGPEYDPEMDQTEEVYEYLNHLLLDD